MGRASLIRSMGCNALLAVEKMNFNLCNEGDIFMNWGVLGMVLSLSWHGTGAGGNGCSLLGLQCWCQWHQCHHIAAVVKKRKEKEKERLTCWVGINKPDWGGG